jgi:hypothetical protein
MINPTIEMLSTERVAELWPALEPHFTAACKGNEVAQADLDAKDLYVLAMTGLIAVFAGFENGKLDCTLAFQFSTTAGGTKYAEVTVLGGRNLMRFKALYWESILDWLRQNNIEYLDAHTSPRLAKIFLSKFGFTKSCVCVRMPLQGVNNV